MEVRFEQKRVCGNQDEITFNTAWKSGSWHAYEPASLDLADEQGIKDKVRRRRGHLSAVTEGARKRVKLYFLIGRPGNDSLVPAYESKKEILAGSPFAPRVVDEEDSDGLVDKIKEEHLSSIEQEARRSIT